MDSKKLAVIHIVKKELQLSDEEYRTILEQVTGVTSAKNLDDAGFRKLMNYFVRSHHYRLNADGMTMRQKLFIKHLVGELSWSDEHFKNFLKKYYHKTKIDYLSRKDASKLIESLKAIQHQR